MHALTAPQAEAVAEHPKKRGVPLFGGIARPALTTAQRRRLGNPCADLTNDPQTCTSVDTSNVHRPKTEITSSGGWAEEDLPVQPAMVAQVKTAKDRDTFVAANSRAVSRRSHSRSFGAVQQPLGGGGESTNVPSMLHEEQAAQYLQHWSGEHLQERYQQQQQQRQQPDKEKPARQAAEQRMRPQEQMTQGKEMNSMGALTCGEKMPGKLLQRSVSPSAESGQVHVAVRATQDSSAHATQDSVLTAKLAIFDFPEDGPVQSIQKDRMKTDLIPELDDMVAPVPALKKQKAKRGAPTDERSSSTAGESRASSQLHHLSQARIISFLLTLAVC